MFEQRQEKRTANIVIRLTTREKQILEKRAHKNKLTTSDYIRQLIKEKEEL